MAMTPTFPMKSGAASAATGSPVGLQGTGYKAVQTFTPEQMQLFQQLFGHTAPGSYLSRLAGGDQSSFEQLEAPALRQFQGLQGQLASRFSGMGTGARRSSGFQNAANQASASFAEQLQSQRMGLQRQAISDLMGMSGQLLGQQPNALMPEQKPFWQELLLAGAGGLGNAFGGGIGKLMGL